jgi:DNA-binding winged helix-turn-helix (wHTH) protein
MKPTRIRFDPFTLDPDSLELWRDGRRVPLPPQPAQVLLVLLRRPGEVVKRQELAELLWTDRHVAVDQGLNSCIRQLRRSLGDSATEPLYVETLPRIGYRFVGCVETSEQAEPGQAMRDRQAREQKARQPEPPEVRKPEPLVRARDPRRGLMVVILCVLLAVLGVGTLQELLHLEVHFGAAEAAPPPASEPDGETAPAAVDPLALLHEGNPLRGEVPCLSGGGRRQAAGAERKAFCAEAGGCEGSTAGSAPSAPSIQIVVRLEPRTASRVESEGGAEDLCRLCLWRQGVVRVLLLPLDRLTRSLRRNL